MSGRSIWEILEVSSTAERAEIRRAYAARLKQTNPEDDAEGFQALRRAYETALSIADHRARVVAAREARVAAGHSHEEKEGEFLVDEAVVATPADAKPAPGPSEPPSPPTEEELARREYARLMSAHAEACNRLGDMIVQGAPAEEQLQAYEGVLASPAIEAVSVHADTERWLAQVLLHGGPDSEPLILRAIEHFGWRAREGAWNLPHEIGVLLARSKDIELVQGLNRRGDFFHNAYQALLTPPSSLSKWRRWRLGRHGDRVRELLSRLRNNYPGVMARLDPEALAWWDRRLAKKPLSARFWVFSAIAALMIFSWLSRGIEPGPPPSRLAELQRQALAHPEDMANMVELCRQRGRLGQDLQAASADCDTAVNSGRQKLAALDARALVRLRLTQMDKAREDYEAILKLSPNDARALYGRGLVRRWADDPKAMADFEKAVVIEPTVAQTFAAYEFKPPALDGLTGARRIELRPPPAPPPGRIRVPRGTEMTYPKPLRRPIQAEMEGSYPKAALIAREEGRVVLHCGVALSGSLTDCVVWSETPQDHGFGDAALSIAQFFRFTPLTIGGKPDARGQVNIPIRFNIGLADEPTPPSA